MGLVLAHISQLVAKLAIFLNQILPMSQLVLMSSESYSSQWDYRIWGSLKNSVVQTLGFFKDEQFLQCFQRSIRHMHWCSWHYSE